MTPNDYTELVEVLRGSSITEIVFVRDYMQIETSGWRMTILESPTLTSPQGKVTFPDVGSRSSLVSLVGQLLLDVVVEEGERLYCRFSNGVELIVPLNGPHAHKKQDVAVIDVGSGKALSTWVF